jgi:serine/threonine-protein kinase
MTDSRSVDAPSTAGLGPTLAYTPLTSQNAPPGATVGLVTGSTPNYAAEIEALLRSRLRAVAICIAGATAVYVVIGLAIGSSQPNQAHMRTVQLAAWVIYGGVFAFLSSGVRLSLPQLRWVEAGIFGLTGLSLVAIATLGTAGSTAAGSVSQVWSGLLIMITAWWGLMNIYLVLIPSSLRRLTIMMILMGLMPIVQLLVYRQQFPLMRDAVSPETLGVIVGLMAIAVGGTIFLGYSVGVLRKQAFSGRLFGQYRLKKLLGSGGMGEVRLAEHVLLKRPCAIKVIHPSRANDPDALARFEREVRAAAELTHPNTIAIYDYGRADDGSFYYVMEYLPGLTLADLVDRYGPLPAERVIYLLRQVCGALAEAHARGLIHRDIKPGNIIVTERGGSADFAKLLDFGLVKPAASDASHQLTQENVIAGSPLFMSPEQSTAGRGLDPRSDLYSLGAVAYFLLTGEPPFSGTSTMEIIVAHARDAVRPPSQRNAAVPKDLEDVVLRCLVKDPESRFPTAGELDHALAACESSGKWNDAAAAQWWSQRPMLATAAS